VESYNVDYVCLVKAQRLAESFKKDTEEGNVEFTRHSLQDFEQRLYNAIRQVVVDLSDYPIAGHFAQLWVNHRRRGKNMGGQASRLYVLSLDILVSLSSFYNGR
jgi:hypothetical protein